MAKTQICDNGFNSRTLKLREINRTAEPRHAEAEMKIMSDDTSWMASSQRLSMICLLILAPLSFILPSSHCSSILVFPASFSSMHVFVFVLLCSERGRSIRILKEASPLGSCSGQSTGALFKVWVERWPLIERLSASEHPLSPSSDVTGHFHTPTLFYSPLFILHWTGIGHNCTVVVVLRAIRVQARIEDENISEKCTLFIRLDSNWEDIFDYIALIRTRCSSRLRCHGVLN